MTRYATQFRGAILEVRNGVLITDEPIETESVRLKDDPMTIYSSKIVEDSGDYKPMLQELAKAIRRVFNRTIRQIVVCPEFYVYMKKTIERNNSDFPTEIGESKAIRCKGHLVTYSEIVDGWQIELEPVA